MVKPTYSQLDSRLPGHNQIGIQQRLVVLAGVEPPAVENFVFHLTPLHLGVVDVGDLQLATGRRLEGRNDVEHPGWIHGIDLALDRSAAGALARDHLATARTDALI